MLLRNLYIASLALVLATPAWSLSDSEFKDIKGDVGAYLELSRKLRAMDEDAVATLVDYVCGIDVDKDKAKAKTEVDRLKNAIQRKVINNYDDLKELNEELMERLEPYQASSEYDSNADREADKLKRDLKTLDRVKSGARLYGSNHPKVRASIAYGVRMHDVLEGTSKCVLNEVKVSASGSDRRADCLRLARKENVCEVVEFKPSSYKKGSKKSKATKQINDYVRSLSRGSGISSKTKSFMQANCLTPGETNKYNVIGKIEYYPVCK